MLRLNNVCREYSKFKLYDVSFELEDGYIMGLIGKNGAGKSTLLKMILGLITPSRGEIEFNGKDVNENEIYAKDNMGFVLAEELFDGFNSLENNAKMYGQFYSRFDYKTFDSLCDKFELDPKKTLNKHSRGEKLKFQFAFALAHDPQLLVLDEPLGAFDPEFAVEFQRTLMEFISQGDKSVLLATHITSELDRIGDFITYIDKGKLLFSKDKESLSEDFKLVIAPEYKIKLLPSENIIYYEGNGDSTKALVRPTHNLLADREYRIETPTIEEIMYFCDKGNYKGE